MTNSKKVITYSLFISLLGFVIILKALAVDIALSSLPVVGFYILLSFVTESLCIDIGNNTYISLGFAISMACVFIFPPAVAGFIIFVGLFLHFEIEEHKILHLFNTSIFKRIFNASAYATIIYCSGLVYRMESPYYLLFGQFMRLSILHVLLAVLTYILLCILIYSILFSMIHEKPLLKAMKEYRWIATNFLAMAPIGLLISLAQEYYGWFGIFLFFGPILLARFSFIQYIQMKENYMRTINSFTKALEAKDPYTNGHSERVAQYAVDLARRLKMPDRRIEELRKAALLHDVGKIGISDSILNKPAKLSLSEMYEIKRHPEIGSGIIEEIDFLKHTARIIRHHHERFDGHGYPDSIPDSKIPLESKIISVVDAFDAMTSNRPYRNALNKHHALAIIENESGRQFNPEIVKAFIDMMGECSEYIEETSEDAR